VSARREARSSEACSADLLYRFDALPGFIALADILPPRRGFECLRPARAGRLWPTATAVGKRQLLTLQPASAGDRNLTTNRQRVARTGGGGPRLFLDSSWTSRRPQKRRSALSGFAATAPDSTLTTLFIGRTLLARLVRVTIPGE